MRAYEGWLECELPPTLLAPLPRLRVLRLRDVAGITISALRKLVKSNEGCLTTIDMDACMWSFKPLDEPLELAFDLSLPSLIRLVSSLPDTCKDLNLGILPIPADHDTWDLVEAAEEKGIDLAFSRCLDLLDGFGFCVCDECVGDEDQSSEDDGGGMFEVR